MTIPAPAAGRDGLLRRLTAPLRSLTESREVIYLVATSGHPNYGDELITEAWLRHLAVRRPLATVIVDSPRPGQSALLLRHANRRAVFVDTLWQLVNASPGPDRPGPADPGFDPETHAEWVAHAASRLGVAPREDTGIDLLLRADVIHLVGGGYVNAMWPHHSALVSAIAEVARRSGARAIATGAGLTPAPGGAARDRLIAQARVFDVFDVRDRPSRELLDGVPGTVRTGDDAWLSRRLQPPAAERDAGVVVCAQSDLTDEFAWAGGTGVEALARFVGDALDAWDVPAREVTVVECMPGHDYTVAHTLGARLAEATVVPFRDVWLGGLPAGRGRTWISTRYHPHLLAAAAGDSGVAVSASPDYYATKHQALIDAGSAWTTVSADDVSIPRRPDAGGYDAAAVRANVLAKRALAEEIYPIGARLR